MAVAPSGVSDAYGPEIAWENAQIEREIAQAVEQKRQKLAAEGYELVEKYDGALGRIVQTRVRIAAASRLPDHAKNELRAAEMAEQLAKIELAKAIQAADEYIRVNRLPGQPARWAAEEGGPEREGRSGKSEADIYHDQYTRPYRTALERATTHRERAELRYGEQVRALAALEAEEIRAVADFDAEEKRHEQKMNEIRMRLEVARSRVQQ